MYPDIAGKCSMAIYALPEFKSSFVQVLNVEEAITVSVTRPVYCSGI